MKVALRGLVRVDGASVLERAAIAGVESRGTFVAPGYRAADAVTVVDAEDTDLVEWEDDGVVQWRPVALFAARARGLEDGAVPIELPARGEDRARGSGALSLLRVAGASEPVASVERALLEETLRRKERSLWSAFDSPRDKTRARKATLVLVHGFASSSEGSFHDWLGSEKRMATLRERYADVLCFDHQTLCDSPVDNAIALAKQLAERGAGRVELLGYSRGGLVAELVARDAKPSDAIDSLMRAKHGVEWPALREKLSALAALQRSLAISKVVRVASPFAGTFLAGELPHAALSLMLGAVLKLTGVPPVAAAGTRQLLLKLLTMVAHRSLPGLFDMRPDAALVRFLDVAARREATAHVAVSAAIEADSDSLWQRPAQWAIEHVYGGPTDLVVPERSALAGVSNDERLCLPGSRTHFDCFSEKEAAYEDSDSRPPNTTLAALLRSPLERPRAIELATGAAESDLHDGATRTVGDVFAQRLRGVRVVIVPGIMGSTLDDPSGRVWLSPTLLHGAFGRLAYNEATDSVRSTGLLEPAYALLKATLASMGATVIDAHYDWREPIEQCAQEVHGRSVDLLSGPWAIIAHSMGGVVARRWLLELKAKNHAALSKLKRVLFLGVPHRGAYSAALARSGEDGLVGLLACADQAQDLPTIVKTIQGFPGLAALEPIDGAAESILPHVQREVAALAALQTQFAHEFAQKRFITVLGTPGQPTACSRVRGEFDTERGDNRVLHSSSTIGSEPTARYVAGHGAIPQAPGFLWDVATLINEGHAASARGALSLQSAVARVASQSLPVVDDESALIAAITGADVATLRAANSFASKRPPTVDVVSDALSLARGADAGAPLKLSVVYGSIRSVQIERFEGVVSGAQARRESNARALVIGRVDQPVLDGVLRDLDVLLDGTMRRRFVLGGVAAEPGSIHSFAGKRAGVPLVVFGLGRMVEFDREAFVNAARAAFEQAAFDAYDDALAQRSERETKRASQVELCSVIPSALGAQSAEKLGSIAVAMIEALTLANRGLARADVRIASFVLYEQYRDSAAALLRAFDAATRSVRVEQLGAERIDVAQTLRRGDGYRGSRLARASALIDVATVSIRASSTGTNTVFEFAYDDGRAALRTDRGELSHGRRATLFELVSKGRSEAARDLLAEVVPQWFERLATSGRDVELVLDVESAAIAWEVVADGLGPRRANFVRRFSGSHKRAPTVASNTALVIADPYTDAPAWSLPGARTEGTAVADALSASHVDVHRAIAVTGDEALRSLTKVLRGGVRILHIAAHGDFSSSAGAGVVLLGASDALDARWWAKLEQVPEVVVFNSCSSGRIAPELQQGIASLAESVLRSGVRLFVAAAWPVSDHGAAAFAVALHRELLEGVAFAEAARRARAVLRATDARTTTWAAYQAYGDPSYRLQQATQAPERYVHDDELIDAALTLIGDLRSQPVEQHEALRKDFDALCAASGLRENGALRYHLGVCALDFNETKLAIEQLEAASRREDAPISARLWWIEARTRAAFCEQISDWSAIEKDAHDNITVFPTAGMHASLGHLYLRRAAVRRSRAKQDHSAALEHLRRASDTGDVLAARVQREARVIELLQGTHNERELSPVPDGATVTHRIARAHDALLRALSARPLGAATWDRVERAYVGAVAMRAGQNWVEFVRIWLECVAGIANEREHVSAAQLQRLAASRSLTPSSTARAALRVPRGRNRAT